MLATLARSTARASTPRSGYVCLSCRANHQLTEASSPLSSDIPPSALPSSDHVASKPRKGGRVRPNHAVLEGNFLATCKRMKIKPPFIHVEGDGTTGWTAKVELLGATHETQAWPNEKMARAKAKGWTLRHMQKLERQSREQEQGQELQKPMAYRTSAWQGGPISHEGNDSRAVQAPASIESKRSQESSRDESGTNVPSTTPPRSPPMDHTPQLRTVPAAHSLVRSVEGNLSSRVARLLQMKRERHRRLEVARARLAGADVEARPATRKVRLVQSRIRDDSFGMGGAAVAKSGEKGAENEDGRDGEEVEDSKSSTSRHSPSRRESPRSKKAKEDLKTKSGAHTIQPLRLENVSLDIPTQGVPSLSYGLDRVLFNPGVYQIQDPRSRVYNFDPYLEKIIDTRHFDFAVLDEFRSPSADNTLSTVAENHNVQYFSSTSAITPVLVHMHFLLSNWRSLSFDDLSAGFIARRGQANSDMAAKGEFTRYLRSPQSLYLKPKQGGYAIDRAEDKASAGLLSFVGQCLEKLFTVPKEVFEMHKKGSTTKPEPAGNGYHYTKFGSVLVRSQLDAHDDRLPGTGIFDIKTRAVLPIRMDSLETSQDIGKGYEIRTLHGEFESYEREFHDMARATMLKYSLQARLGRMDGIFVAYHNIARLFGFQYFSLSDMDKVLHGQTDTALGDAELSSSLRILSDVFDRAVKEFPNEPVRLYFDSRKRTNDLLVFVVPVKAEEIEQQHENSQHVSREYLARLNKSEEQDQDFDEMEAEELLAEESDSKATESSTDKASEAAESRVGERPNEEVKSASDEDSWLNVSTEGLAEGQEISADGESKAEEIGDEISRLTKIAGKIAMETNFLSLEGVKAPHYKVHKMMLQDIARKSFAWEQDIEKLGLRIRSDIEGTTEQNKKDLEDLRHRLEEQKEVNEELFAKAEESDVLTGTELKDLTNSHTLEEVLRASVKRYVVPERMAAFKVKVQSRMDGEIISEPPTNVTKDSDWEVIYQIEAIEGMSDVHMLYTKMLKRQDEAAMNKWESKKLREFYEGGFFQQLMSVSKQSQRWRKERDRLDEGREVVVFEPKN